MSDETLNFQFVLPQVEKAPVGEQGEMAEYIPYKIKAGVTMESILAELRAQPHMASLLPYLNPGRRLYLLKSSGLELLKLAAQYIGTYHFLDHPDDEAYVTTSEPEQSGADGGKDEDDAWRSGGTQAREFNFGENMPYLKALELQQFYGSDDTPFGFGQQLYLPDQWARHRPW